MIQALAVLCSTGLTEGSLADSYNPHATCYWHGKAQASQIRGLDVHFIHQVTEEPCITLIAMALCHTSTETGDVMPQCPPCAEDP